MSTPTDSETVLRIGAVKYLNSKPLVHGLSEALPTADVIYDLPSRLADQLKAGTIHVALVPIVEYLRQPKFRLVSNACVGCRGPVLSVKVYFRTAPEQVKTLALDEGSRTSAALAQVLLYQHAGVRPQLQPLPIGDRLEDSSADAVLLIGDRAMYPPSQEFHAVWDLGEQWCQQTGLPFVFAAWVAGPEMPYDVGRLATVLEQVRDQGLAAVDTIATRESTKLGIERELAYHYLSENLHFRMGPAEQQGIEQYARRCVELKLIDEPVPPHRFRYHSEYDDCTTH
ncbi:menaquinone biosynthetic enzyme MqnA/MqnD family protein [Aeoliella mucimassa]|uniref:Chorismate dehydratase n=1 Tax=Aeoliella mucimassa TaxID=2527972 RepID=A0A518AP15_9BACT|nr:menaquinone biosynthesis protein [Aeoliella mucimassa]QDU56468.1 Chorismate dehydratase [Aeoliella mucimassa]